MKKIVIGVFCLVVSLAAGAAGAYDASSYVQDGLIAQWDGIDNAGTGVHDPMTNIWKDLKGTLDMTLTANGSWFDGWLKVEGCSAKGKAKAPAYKTIEIFYRRDPRGGNILFAPANESGGNLRYVIMTSAGDKVFFEGGKKNWPAISIPVDEENRSIAAVYDDNNTITNVYRDGESVLAEGAKNSASWNQGDKVIMVGARKDGGTATELSYRWYGRVYAIRLYDRALTAEEFAANHAVDVERFHGGVGELLVKGTPEDLTDAVSPAYGITDGYADGETVPVSVPAYWTEPNGDYVTVCRGRKVFARDASHNWVEQTTQSGTEPTFDLTYMASGMKVEWLWEVSNLVSVVTRDASRGSVSTAGGYFLPADSVTVTATPQDGYAFSCWGGDVPDALRYEPTIVLQADQPRRVVACFVEADGPAADNVRYLAPWGADTNDGTSWDKAIKTVGVAATAANALAGSTVVVVAPGAYPVAAQVDKLTSAVTFRGASGAPEDAVLQLASGQVRMFWLDNAAAALENLTLEGGTGRGSAGDSSSNLDGRGRNTYVTAGTLRNCIVQKGSLTSVANAKYRSVLVYLNGADALMTHCVVRDNVMTGSGSSGTGGYSTPGVLLDGGARIEYTLVANNRDTSNRTRLIEAGGITVVKGTADHCTVVGNWAPYAGGMLLESNGKASNCVICGNHSFYNGKATDDVVGTASSYENCQISVSPETILANWWDGDYRSAAGTAASGLGYADAPVSFTVDSASGFVPFVTSFTAQDVEGATAYSWDFDGDGVFEMSGQTVEHGYQTPGWQEVTLAVETSDGTKTVRKRNFVKAVNRVTPVADAEDLQPAIDAQLPGGVVEIQPGRYAIDRQLEIWKDIRVVGTGATPEDVVIEIGSSAARGIHVNSPNAFVANLTSEGGAGLGTGLNAYVENLGGTFSNCVFRGAALAGTFNANATAVSLFLRGANAFLTHSVVTNNSSTCGGNSPTSGAMVHGVYLSTGATMENTLVADNVDTGNRQNASSKNYATVYGNGTIRNCTIVNNSCSDAGGVRLTAGKIVDSVVAGNVSMGLIGQNNISTETAGTVSNCVTDDEEAFNDSCAVGAVASIFKDWANKVYTPVAGTVLVDTGTGVEAEQPSVDLAGNPRVQGEKVDIGCYELDASQFGVTLGTDETSCLVPRSVTFTATVTGSKEGDSIRYYWDFDGDGVTDLETTEDTATHLYSDSGQISVGVAVTNFTGTVRGTGDFRLDYLTLMPKTIYFDPSATHSKLPYASWETAATNLQEAVDAAFGGMTIKMAKGTYGLAVRVRAENTITLVGATEDPNDVVFRKAGSDRLFYLGGGACLANCALEGAAEPMKGGAVYVTGTGGMISNVILRGVSYSATMNSSHAASPIYMDGVNSLATHMIVTGNTTTCNGSTTASSVINVLAFDLREGARVENTLMAYNSDNGRRTAVGTPMGGLVYGNGKLVNCTIVSNYCKATSEVKLTAGAIINTVIAGNASDPSQDVTEPDLHAGSTSLCDHSQVGGDLELMFANPAALNWTPKCRKGEDSLYNAGTTENIDLPAKDLRGNPRLRGRKVDIGCYETTYGLGLSMRVW